ncbi:hypothetical protein B9T31_09465 [Acinetobacter sp. ANC 4558]|uniref:hypothetical protein n=1 Tax=Acinetobacter sp. ANC 4558 TaxID=1977876 RepID=UPI000A3540D6|nr:hypothetical protein [Acinetobacter sp. ANC 4558]OTG85814.1 hypothetical protein B9T31_09465 [Acinetobacter sp. ANC 4558]
MKKILGLCLVFTCTFSNAFNDEECVFLLKDADKNGVLNKALKKDKADAKLYWLDPSDERIKTPVSCKNPISNYEKIVCSDDSLKKLDQIAYTTYIYNAINANGERLDLNDLSESDLNKDWVNRLVADKESVCLKLKYMDQVDRKLRY